MKDQDLMQQLLAMTELPRPAEYEKIRLEFENEESDPPSPDDMATRVAWYTYGLTAFQGQFVEHFCDMKQDGETIPNIPVDGPGELPMTLNELIEFLTPDYLGQQAYREMFFTLENMLLRLIETFPEVDYAKGPWNERLNAIRTQQFDWMEADESTQPAA